MNPKPRLPTKFSFKGGSPPSIPNPSFFLASPNLGTRFLLRAVVCHIPKFGMRKINKIGTMFVILIEISQGIKTFFFIQKLY
jgi:hypothetical protein